ELLMSCLIGGDDANLAYNESISLDLEGPLSLDALKKASDDLVKRHESLRATVSKNGKFLCIHQHLPCGYRLVDLSGYSLQEIPDRMATIEKEDASELFDLYDGPLIRLLIFRKGD